MSDKTGIQWTDATWNPVVGCTKVSQGCKHCYAKTLHDLRHKALLAGKKVAPQYAQPFETVQLMPERLYAPISWRKPRRVFVNSVSDLFHEDVPFDYIDRVFATMAVATWHTYQILTKRPSRMQEYCGSRDLAVEGVPGWAHPVQRQIERIITERSTPQDTGLCAWPLPNVWLGVSVENQAAADERIPLLLQTPAAVRFLSCEPLLGLVDLEEINEQIAPSSFMTYSALDEHGRHQHRRQCIDWVIVGGESGKNARPCNLEWVEQILADCDVNCVAAFVKQLGACAVDCDLDVATRGPRLPLKDSHGGDMAEWPERLRVREFPRVEAAR